MSIKAGPKVCIYALRDPRTHQVRYIGKATDPDKRLREHLSPAQLNRYKSRKNSWIKSLLADGHVPAVTVLHRVPAEMGDRAERAAIAVARIVGDPLTNGTNGGDGGAVTDVAALARIRAAHLGVKASVETRGRMSRSAKARCADPQERDRLRSISNGKPPLCQGAANGWSKVTEEQVKEIRRLAASGLTSGEIAPLFGLTYQNVWYIVTRKTWRHIP